MKKTLAIISLFCLLNACQKDDDTGNSNTGTNTSGNTTGCPTTANCGCSNKLKADCNSSCCQWIVGTGCRCR